MGMVSKEWQQCQHKTDVDSGQEAASVCAPRSVTTLSIDMVLITACVAEASSSESDSSSSMLRLSATVCFFVATGGAGGAGVTQIAAASDDIVLTMPDAGGLKILVSRRALLCCVSVDTCVLSSPQTNDICSAGGDV